MSDNFSNEIELEEDYFEQEEDEVTEGNLVSDTFYIQQGQIKFLERFPLVFTVPDKLSPVILEGFTLAWTKKSLLNFADIQKQIHSNGGSNGKNLPYASLRGYLEVELKNAAQIESSLGLSKRALNREDSKYDPEPFVYLDGGNEEEINKTLRPILNDWITKYLKPFAEKEEISTKTIERLEELQDKNDLLKITPLKSQVLPWIWSQETGTTQHRNQYDYRVLADYVARQIAGQEIFQGLGPMKRIISSNGTFTSGRAELITEPRSLKDTKGKFSLVLRLEVITFPSLHQPLLKVDISKRRWLTQLKSPRYNSNDISGFIFSQDHSDRAFSYKVQCKEEKKNKNEKNNQQNKSKNWTWETDKDFEVLRRKLQLGLQSFDGQQIALGQASTDSCEVVLTYSNGLQDNSEDDEDVFDEYGIEAGVPEIDKLEAFEAIAKILQLLEIQVFDDYSLLKVSHDVDDTASRMINLPTLIGGVIEVLETNANNLKFTPKYLEQFNDIQLDSLLVKYFDIRLEEIERGRKALQFTKIKRKDQSKELKSLIQANQAAMRRLYPNERPSLYIFYEDNMLREVELVKEITRILWGDTLEIIANRLPPNTHGPQEDILVGKDLKAKKRSGERIKAWKSIAKQIQDRNKPTFCLIIASKFYPDPTGQKAAKIDDKVNKPSTRQALATMAGACVQFLQPIAKTQKTKRFKLENFFHRLQSAMKDLLFARSGRIDDVQEKVDKYLKSIPPEARPKEIIVFTIDRKQSGRARGAIGNTFLAVAIRIKVDAGKCELCCAYEKGNQLTISPWSSFPDGLAFIAGLTPVKLADKPNIYKTRFMDFVKKIASKSVEAGTQPLIIIDSSNCVQLWPWLKDVEINTNKIDLGSHENMQDEWQGARLIRIRQEIAPGIIEKKERYLIETFLEDTRTKEELNQLPPTLKIPSASSSIGLFRLSATHQTGCVAYLSVRKLPHQYSRGQSCYRSTDTLVKKTDGSKEPVYNKAGLNIYQLSKQAPFVGRWPTPNPLEIVVTLRQPEDNPDDLAALVESLRYGFGHYSDWTALPGPLFFERVVRDYISDFAIADEDIESEQD